MIIVIKKKMIRLKNIFNVGSSLENGNHVSKIQFEEDEKVIKIGIVHIQG